jgi:DNA-binding NarL/FixJ family response regulator
MVAFGLTVALQGEDDIAPPRHVSTIGASAAAIAEHRPHVVLMDYHLPDGNGIDAARSIKAAHPRIAVLLVTGSADDWVFAEALEVCDGFVEKTQPFEDLVAAIRAAGRGETVIPPAKLGTVLPLLRRLRTGPGHDLTRREREVLELMSEGLTNSAIADRLCVSVHTVRNHVGNVLSKLNAHSKLEAVTTATRHRIV